ncbi:VCBS repeat-containing protein [uncultured Cyclobacterium sp.]|uniref:FG-GAP repeat domain-containing protein n=1 Tax=uncultured Cyclobacterium sp. TaxID=453820 RepID=UPI0030EC7C59|tara:strand:+ start:40774 stop:42369 length:1596 start_codon:yes stop_codon:yes gene_type:complete
MSNKSTYSLKVFSLCLLLQFSCGSPEEKKSTQKLESENAISGKELSEKHCQSCHLYPKPSELDKNTWERSVLPLMGRLFGIYELEVPRSKILEGAIDKKTVEEGNMFPEKPSIAAVDWEKIKAFYLAEAPEVLDQTVWEESKISHLEGFEMVEPEENGKLQNITFLKTDPTHKGIYVGGASGERGSLAILNSDNRISQMIPLPSAPTDVAFGKDELSITLAGSLRLSPGKNKFGDLITLFRNPGELQYSSFRKFLSQLNRPVQTFFEDINGNGLTDILVAEFGYYTGALTLFENTGLPEQPYKKTSLKNVSGAIHTEVQDMNGDGKKDIVALFAQGDEGVSIFYNEGEGQFTEERVLRFPPTYGSVSLDLVDFNQDGHLDILYGNGDNGDYPPIAKSYHGLRIFENDGENNFKQVYFFPMNGVNKCAAADFDQDGKLEIVAVAYFPDFDLLGRQDFVYLQPEGLYAYKAHILEEKLDARWITFEIGDIDLDGDLDLLLGSNGKYYSKPPTSMEIKKPKGPLMILKNQMNLK